MSLTKRSAEAALMPPPPPPKKIKRPGTVIDEDKYTDGLAHIIARDFFPGLATTDSTQEYLDALDSRDVAWIEETRQKLTQMMTPGPEGSGRRIPIRQAGYTPGHRAGYMPGHRAGYMPGHRAGETPRRREGHGDGDGGYSSCNDTPRGWRGETPRRKAETQRRKGETPRRDTLGVSGKEEITTDISLSAFQAKYTSEDNESFNKILDKANMERRRKNAWLWNGNTISRPGDIMRKAQERRLLEDTSKPSADGALVLTEQIRDKRPAMPEVKPSAPKNTFMFHPESIEDERQTTAQAAEAKSLAPPKSINHAGTRIPLPELEGPVVPPSPSMSAVDAAIGGRPRFAGSEAGFSGAETPRVAGYKFVDAEVQPHEQAYMDSKTRGESDSRDDEILKLLSQSSSNPFRLGASSERERIHEKLLDKIKKNTRPVQDRKGTLIRGDTAGRTPTPKFASAGKMAPGNLTPAQQSLLRKVSTPLRRGE